MLKALAVLRTLFLIFIVVFTLRGMPIWGTDQDLRRAVRALLGVAGLDHDRRLDAIAWIAFETAVGWWLATRQSRRSSSAAAPPPKAAGV